MNDDLPPAEKTIPPSVRIEIVAPQAPQGESIRPEPAASLALEYTRALAWPALIGLLLLFYRPPLGRLAEHLVERVGSASKVSFGSFSVEVAAQARGVGSPGLAESLGELSAPAVAELMRTPRNGAMILLSTMDAENKLRFGLPDSTTMTALGELEEKGFIRFDEPLDQFLTDLTRATSVVPDDSRVIGEKRKWHELNSPSDSERFRSYGYGLTDKGGVAVEAITRAVASQLAVPSPEER